MGGLHRFLSPHPRNISNLDTSPLRGTPKTTFPLFLVARTLETAGTIAQGKELQLCKAGSTGKNVSCGLTEIGKLSTHKQELA